MTPNQKRGAILAVTCAAFVLVLAANIANTFLIAIHSSANLALLLAFFFPASRVACRLSIVLAITSAAITVGMIGQNSEWPANPLLLLTPLVFSIYAVVLASTMLRRQRKKIMLARNA